MSTSKERLKRFLSLADQGPTQRLALAEDLIDFLIDWPADCPRTMRPPVIALLDMTLKEADDFTRRRMAARVDRIADLPLAMVNRLFHCAPKAVRTQILSRNEVVRNLPHPIAIRDPAQLVTAARRGVDRAFCMQLARAMHIEPRCAEEILADDSGQSLATLCKGTGVARGLYSALALLIFAAAKPDPARLGIFEHVTTMAAENMVSFWQSARQIHAA